MAHAFWHLGHVHAPCGVAEALGVAPCGVAAAVAAALGVALDAVDGVFAVVLGVPAGAALGVLVPFGGTFLVVAAAEGAAGVAGGVATLLVFLLASTACGVASGSLRFTGTLCGVLLDGVVAGLPAGWREAEKKKKLENSMSVDFFGDRR